MGTLFFVILILFVSTVGKIVQVQRASKFGTKGAKSHAGTLKAQIRLLIFIFIVGVISFSIFEWRLQIEGSKTSSAVGIQWAYCKVKLELGLSRDNICPGDINPSRIPYDHTAFESFLLSGIGILMFIAFGSDFGLYRHWLKIFKLAFSNEWGTLKKFVVNGVDPYPYSSNVVNVQTDTGTSTSKPLHSGGVSLSSNSSASATHSS